MRFRFPFFCVFGLVFTLSGVALAGMGVKANLSPGGLIVGVQKLADGRKLVVLGVRSQDERYPSADQMAAQGFRGNFPKLPERFDPSFLILADEGGLRNVYSFELGAFREGTQAWELGNAKAREHHRRMFEAQKTPEKQNALPPKLLNVEHARRNLTFRFLGNIGLIGAQFTPPPIGPIAAATLLYAKQVDKIRDKQAAFLAQAVDLELSYGKLPELRKVFSQKDLEKLGSALLVRYNMESRWKGILVDSDDQVKYYYETLRKRDEREMEHLAQLEKLAKEKGLYLSRLGPGFALLSIPRSGIFVPPGTKVDPKVQKWLDRYQELGPEAGELIPYGIFALREKKKNLDLVEFPVPLKGALQQKITDLTLAAFGMSYVFLDLIPAMTLEASVNFVERVIGWLGFTVLEYRLEAFGRLQANLKLGAVDLTEGFLDGHSIVIEAILDYARGMDVPDAEIERMKNELEASPPSQVGFALGHLLNELMELESRSAAILESTDLEQIRRVKRIHIDRLGNWLTRERQVAEKNAEKAAKKESRRQARKQKSLETIPAAVLP